MKTAELMEIETRPMTGGETIVLPYGLLGFEQVKNYVLLAKPEEEPFMWLQMLDGGKQAFLVVSPFLVSTDYQPDISDDDVEFLGLTEPADALLLNIVTLLGNGQATVNLKGPVVVNRHTLVGKQVIPNNAARYNLRHPVPVS
jgi:flagellar assembly factor FliW